MKEKVFILTIITLCSFTVCHADQIKTQNLSTEIDENSSSIELSIEELMKRATLGASRYT